MLKTLDILIGATYVLLVFSMALTILTQTFTTVFARRGAHLLAGLADLLQLLGISERKTAEKIADSVLRHPMISQGRGVFGKSRLGTVIHREEFTKILLDAASGDGAGMWAGLSDAARESLKQMLTARGVADPAATLKNVRTLAMQLEASNPELATDARQSLALLHEAESDYLARMNSWFDQTIDRVSQRFAKHAHLVTVCLAILIVLAVQLDMLAVVNRLSVDDQLRNEMVKSAINDPCTKAAKDKATSSASNGKVAAARNGDPCPAAVRAAETPPAAPVLAAQTPAVPAKEEAPNTSPKHGKGKGKKANPKPIAVAAVRPATGQEGEGKPKPETVSPAKPDLAQLEAQPYYDALSAAGLITLPFGPNWAEEFTVRKIPGMILAILLISLGAPFWYNILKDLLGLRSALAKKDDMQRLIRQTTQDSPAVAAAAAGTSSSSAATEWLKGEKGDLRPWG